jgi:hypothetical protein
MGSTMVPPDVWRSLETWSKRLLRDCALCVVVGVAITIAGMVLIAAERDDLGVPLAALPGALFLAGLPSDLVGRIPDAVLFPFGMVCAVTVWTIVALGTWRAAALITRLVSGRGVR